MPNDKHVKAVVKSVYTSGYDNYLQKIKRISARPIQTPFQPNSCKSCKLIVKKGEQTTYDNYLNSIKSNIIKDKYTNIGVNIDCKCNADFSAVNDSNTIYYVENNVYLRDNQQAILENSTTTNIVPFRSAITTQ
jgi:hypothetical protein